MTKTARHRNKTPQTADSKTPAESGREIMQAVLSKPSHVDKDQALKDSPLTGIVIGELSDPGKNGEPMVRYPGMPQEGAVAAVSTADLSDQKPGREVALSFVNGNPSLPIILGLIQNPAGKKKAAGAEDSGDQLDVQLDGEKLTLSADREIVLKCGKSSISLTRAGKIIIKGEYLSNHSTGVNRIKGGSVQIN